MNNNDMIQSYRTCDDFGLLISLALDNEISPDEQALLSAHVKTCTECRERSQNFSRIAHEVGAIGTVDEFESMACVSNTKSMLGKPPGRGDRGSRFRGWWFATSLVAAAGLAAVLVNWNAQAIPAQGNVDIVGPMVSLSEINSRRILDQEMLRESLQLDLRTLKLQLYALNDSNEAEVLGRINRLMDRIDQTSVARSDIN